MNDASRNTETPETDSGDYAPGWNVFPVAAVPEKRDASGNVMQEASPPRLDVLLRTPAGVERSYIVDPAKRIADGLLHTTILEPGTADDDGNNGKSIPVVITPKSNSLLLLTAYGKTWQLRCDVEAEKTHFFAFWDQRPPKGEPARLSDIFGAFAPKKR